MKIELTTLEISKVLDILKFNISSINRSIELANRELKFWKFNIDDPDNRIVKKQETLLEKYIVTRTETFNLIKQIENQIY